jgi:hypothetical protein
VAKFLIRLLKGEKKVGLTRDFSFPSHLCVCAPGLPDFSRHNIPKRGKIYEITTTLPNGHKIYQIIVKYSK